MRFLAVGCGLAAASAGAGLWWIQPRNGWLVPEGDGQQPRTTKAPRHVVVIGGGLAGLSAATILSERGHKVTLLEAASHLGGKVGGWSVDVDGVRQSVEHGFHGFFHQYANLRRLLGRAQALTPASFTPAVSYPIAFPDGPVEHFGTSTTLFPANLLDVIRRSPSLRFMDFKDADRLLEICKFDPATTFRDFDDVDFATWLREARVPPAMVDIVMRPFGETTLNRLERLSAAEAFKFFHFYFVGAETGLGFDLLKRDSAVAVVEPLAAHARALGVVVEVGAAVSRVVTGEGGSVSGVVVGAEDAAVVTDIVADGAVSAGGVPLWCDRKRGVAFDLRCTHQGCPVQKVADGFACPCHGGRYDEDGAVTGGPPPRPLRRLPIVDDKVVMPRDQGRFIAADAVVIATDTAGARGIIERSGLPIDTAAVQESEPFCVVRWWFDRPVQAERPAFFTTARFRLLDSLALYSQFQDDAKEWAAAHGGSVVEAHAYAIGDDEFAEVSVLADRMLRDVLLVLPELVGARVVHQEAQLQRSFSRFAPGDHRRRPSTTTSVPNLLLAGDWVRIDAPVALMEGAVVSGVLAANAILASEALAPESIPIVAPRGPLS
jgi:isorenieratene synthase